MSYTKIFTLDGLKNKGPAHRLFLSTLGGLVERGVGLNGLNDVYNQAANLSPEREFMARTLDVLDVGYELPAGDFDRIPTQGPVVVVANHPFGAVEGVILGALLKRVRPDVKIMGNYLLGLMPELQEMIISVDNFGSAASLKKNIKPLKDSIRWLRAGHMLAVFPSGEVSSLDIRKRRIMDPVWSRTVGRIIHHTEAPVLPIFFPGSNGPLFHLAGLLHPRLRTVLLPHFFLGTRHKMFQTRVGALIPYKKLEKFDRDDKLMAYLRLRTYMLKARDSADAPPRSPLRKLVAAGARHIRKEETSKPPRELAPVVEEKDPADLEAELACLPPENLLLELNEFQVYKAKAGQIPLTLEELGRLREHTFRLVGEGTGKPTDLDHYDSYYDHLFVWAKDKREIVGAYRIGRSTDIIREHGVEGFYTSSLFSFKPALFERLGPSLEMGRSFVRPKYQRSFAPLMLLWKGICHYVLLSPDYKNLFGPVSISSDYSMLSREMMVRYLRANNSISELSKLVKPKLPPKLRKMRRHEVREFRNVVKSIEDMTEVITDIEPVVKGIPVLLKQYLKLGGKILAFNVDPDFNNCLDGLIYVDLTQASPRILGNYMGKDNLINFLDYHATKRATLEQIAG